MSNALSVALAILGFHVSLGGLFVSWYVSPLGKRLRQHRADVALAREEDAQMRRVILGVEPVTIRGRMVAPGIPGLAETVDQIQATVAKAALLNGKGEHLLATSERQSSALQRIEDWTHDHSNLHDMLLGLKEK